MSSVGREKLFLKRTTLYLGASGTLTAIPLLLIFGERVLGAILPLDVAMMSAQRAMFGVYLCGKRRFRVSDELDAAILRVICKHAPAIGVSTARLAGVGDMPGGSEGGAWGAKGAGNERGSQGNRV